MNKFFKRIGAILLALTLCLGTTLTAFAAENENDTTISSTRSSSFVYKDFTTSTTIEYNLSTSGSTNFKIAVMNNPSGLYNLVITYQDGSQIYSGVWPGNGSSPAVNVTWAKAGLYTFSYIYSGGTYKEVTAVAGVL